MACYYYDTADNASLHTVAKGSKGWIGSPQREECNLAGTDPTTNLHYYDVKGRPSLELAQTDGKWFYTYTDYAEPDGSDFSRPTHIHHYWKPSGHEAPTDLPYAWQSFGYTYAYDGSGAGSKSYLVSIKDNTNRTWWDQPSYDYLDRVTSVRKGAGHVTTRTYRATDGQLTGIATDNGIQNLSYDCDGLGNLTSRGDGTNSETYGYDNLNRLTTRGVSTIANYQANGNINTKTEVGNTTVAITAYDSVHPHAASQYTFGGQTFNIAYDANGNLDTRSGGGTTWYMKWAGFDKPRWMAKTTGSTTVGSEFHYNAGRSRVMQLEFDAMSGTSPNLVPSHYVRKRLYGLGSTLEVNYNNTAGAGATPTWVLATIGGVRIYVPGPDGIIGAREFNSTQPAGQQEKTLVYHYDHLGSVQAITTYGDAGTSLANDTGGKPGKFSEDAWGQRRNPFTWSGAPVTTGNNKSDDGSFDSLTPRGFTGHEMLDDLGLVHMNGRIYDSILSRFLSADLIVQAPGSLQSYNRYSYVMNNPLSLIDPSGFKSQGDASALDEDERMKRAQADLAKLKALGVTSIDITLTKNGEGQTIASGTAHLSAKNANSTGDAPFTLRITDASAASGGVKDQISPSAPSSQGQTAANPGDTFRNFMAAHDKRMARQASITNLQNKIHVAISDFSSLNSNYDTATNLARAQVVATMLPLPIAAVSKGLSAYRASKIMFRAGYAAGFEGLLGPTLPRGMAQYSSFLAKEAGEARFMHVAREEGAIEFGKIGAAYLSTGLQWAAEPFQASGEGVIEKTEEVSHGTAETIKTMQHVLMDMKRN